MSTTQERTAMDEWVFLFANRDNLSYEYARLLRTKPATWPTWIVLNMAIIDRWSLSGLEYVKRKAWKIAQNETDV